MSEFVTLDRSHPDFNNFLLGTPSGEDRIAVPVQSYHVNQLSERVTFRFVEAQNIRRPAIYKVITNLFRLDLLPLVMVPALNMMAMAISTPGFESKPWAAGLIILALAAINSAVYCGNDFIDHMKGVDRLSDKSGSRVIQNGWLRANTVQKLFWSMIFFSVCFAIPIFILNPFLILLSALTMLLGVLGYTFLKWRKLGWLLSDIAIWSCMGPLLVVGVVWGLGVQVTTGIIWVGAFYGLMAVTYFELRHLVSSMADHEAKIMTLPVRFGFDRAKNLLALGMLFSGLIFSVVVTMTWPDLRSLFGLPLALRMIWIGAQTYKIKSPLSSTLYVLQRKIIRTYIWVGLFMVLSYVANYFY